MKKTTSLTIDADILEQAKNRLFNISAVCEEALRVKLGQNINIEEDSRQCYRCGGLASIWDGYSEVWVCEKCNNNEIKQVSIMAKI